MVKFEGGFLCVTTRNLTNTAGKVYKLMVFQTFLQAQRTFHDEFWSSTKMKKQKSCLCE